LIKSKKMGNNIYTRDRKKGFILVLTLLISLILATLVIGFLSISSIDLVLVKNHMYSLKAYYIAEAGVADAINQIRLNGPLADMQWEAFFPSGSDKYTVAVSQSSTVISSTGLAYAANFSRALDVKISISGSSPPYKVSIKQWKEVVQ
jgi:Tfp pilus assembly protein PilX